MRTTSAGLRLLAVTSVSALLLGSTACHRFAFPKLAANYREYAYVSDGGAGTVTVLDLVNLRLDHTIQVGSNPSGEAVNPVRNEIYVVNTGSSSVSAIDANSQTVTATMGVHGKPYSISVDAKGERGYVANSASNTVSVLDLVNHREIAIAGTGEQPGMAVISPDGRSLVVSNRGSGSVSIYDISDAPRPQLRATFAGCEGATDIAILPDSSKAFIACSGADQVLSIGLASAPGSWAARQDGATMQDRLLARLHVGKTPVHLALKPDGGEIFVENFGSNTVSEIATYTSEVGSTFPIGTSPTQGLVSPDNGTLWVSNFGADSIAVYSIDDGRLATSVHTGPQPDAMALALKQPLLLVADAKSGDVTAIRINGPSGPALFTMLPAGSQPNAIVVKGFTVK